MNVVFLTGMRGALTAPRLVYDLLTIANDGPLSSVEDLEVTGAMSSSAEQGWQAVSVMSSYMNIASVICFGKTCASLGMPDMPYFTLEYARLPSTLPLTNVMRVPAATDEWWTWDDNTVNAAISLKAMLVAAPLTAPAPHIAWPVTSWN